MENKTKSVRNINAGVKISEEDDKFLQTVSELKGEKKYMRSKIAYMLMQRGMDSLKKELSIESKEISNVVVGDITNIVKITSVLKQHGLSLIVKSTTGDENEN